MCRTHWYVTSKIKCKVVTTLPLEPGTEVKVTPGASQPESGAHAQDDDVCALAQLRGAAQQRIAKHLQVSDALGSNWTFDSFVEPTD